MDMSGTKADEVALELIKQLITLSAGVLALSATFIDKLPRGPSYVLLVLLVSWIALVLSIYCGLKTISTIVKSRLESNDDWSKKEGKTYARWCQHFFLSGITVFASFAYISLILCK
jgi:hypothetical protein